MNAATVTNPGGLASRFAGAGSSRVAATGSQAVVADSFRLRLLGLAMVDRERAPEALLLPRCRSIHTFGMRFPLDVYFLDPWGRAIRVVRGLRPRRFARDGRAAAVLEIPSRGGA